MERKQVDLSPIQEVINIALKKGFSFLEIKNHPTEGRIELIIIPINKK